MGKMTDEFKDKIIEAVEMRIEVKDIEIKDVKKNNGVTYTGLYIATGNDVAPIIPLDSFFNRYQDNENINDLADEIVDTYQRLADPVSVKGFKEGITDYETAKELLCVTLVNRELNKDAEYLKKEFLDLYIVPKLVVDDFSSGFGTVKIRKSWLDAWGVTEEQLYADAIKNSEELLPATVKSMKELFAERYSTDISDNGMFIITNSKMLNGASAVLYDGVLKELSARMDSDLIIIPSSIHECLAVSADEFSPLCVTQMVKEVNESEVDDQEILSDHAYLYKRSTGVIQCA